MFCNKNQPFLDKYLAQYLVKLTFFETKTDERPFAGKTSGLQQKQCEPRSNAQNIPLLLHSRVENLNFHPTHPSARPPTGSTPSRAGRRTGRRVGRNASKTLYCLSVCCAREYACEHRAKLTSMSSKDSSFSLIIAIARFVDSLYSALTILLQSSCNKQSDTEVNVRFLNLKKRINSVL